MEFTHLGKKASPISLGAVSDNDKAFYAEFTDYNKHYVKPWVYKNVIENLWLQSEVDSENTSLSFSDGTRYECYRVAGESYKIASRFLSWLDSFDGDITLIADVCYYDKVILDSIFSWDATTIPIPSTCRDVNTDIARHLGIPESDAFFIDREEYAGIDTDAQKHNSLWDAHIVRKCCVRAEENTLQPIQRASDDSQVIIIECSQSIFPQLSQMLDHIRRQVNIGHSFHINIEGERFDFDGDGPDAIYQIVPSTESDERKSVSDYTMEAG